MEAFKQFLAGYPAKPYDKGELILYQGEVPRAAYVIKSGIVKAYNISSAGDEKPIAFHLPLEVFPTPWAFKKASSTIYFYEAFTACQVHCIPREALLEFIYSDQTVLAMMLDTYVTNYVGKTMQINALEHSRAVDKILHTLHYLCLSVGREIKPNIIEVQLPLTQQDLANLMGLTRETTGIELNRLKKTGLVNYSRKRCIVNIVELRRVLGEEEFKDLQLT